MKVLVTALVAVGSIGALFYTGLTFRDTIGRATGTRRDTLVRRQRFGLIAVVFLPIAIGSAWLLDMPLGRLWWMFLIAGLEAISLVASTIQLRNESQEEAD